MNDPITKKYHILYKYIQHSRLWDTLPSLVYCLYFVLGFIVFNHIAQGYLQNIFNGE